MEQEVSIPVPGGPLLEGRLGMVQEGRAGLVVCHPHPLYGGDMDNPVVVRVAEVAREEGLSTLRFNFRGVGRSSGAHGGGDGERGDLAAAMAILHSRLPVQSGLGLAGYSFGAWIAAGVALTDMVAALALIAPPVTMLDFDRFEAAAANILLVSGSRDDYCPVPRLEELASRIPRAQTVIVEGADHFFFGKLFPLGETIREWVRRWTI